MKKLFLAFGLITTSLTQAFIYELKIVRLWDKQNKRYIYFVGCSDYHDKQHRVTAAQLAAINNLLGDADPKKVKIIIEDLSCKDNGERSYCGNFLINSRGGILGGLAQKCCARGFTVVNAEHRYCRVCALGPLLNNPQVNPHTCASVKATLVKALACEVEKVITEIQGYKDGSMLQARYAAVIRSVRNRLRSWQRSLQAQLSVADYVEQHSKQPNRLDFVKELLTFDSGLIDARMVHAALNAGDHTTVVAFAGGAHITRVIEMLIKWGYELVYETDVRYIHEHDLKKCVGSTIVNGTYCVRPEPISLDLIKRYL